MANPEDDVRQEGGPPDGRPRRQPPIIDVKAVEVSPDGPGAAASGPSPGAGPTSTTGLAKRILGLLPSMKIAVIGSVCVIAVVAAGVLWIYLTLDGVGGSQRNAAVHEAAKSDDVIEGVPKLETVLKELRAASPDTDFATRLFRGNADAVGQPYCRSNAPSATALPPALPVSRPRMLRVCSTR